MSTIVLVVPKCEAAVLASCSLSISKPRVESPTVHVAPCSTSVIMRQEFKGLRLGGVGFRGFGLRVYGLVR